MKRALAIALLCTSCSLVMRDAPSTLSPIAEPDCSDSRAAPVIDLIGAGTTIYTGLLILALNHAFGSHDPNNNADLAAGVIGIGGTAAFVASAVNGFGTASRCREAKRTWYLTMAPGAPAAPAAPNPANAMPPPGYERGWCREPPGAPCNPGLTCASSRCVLLPPPPALAPPAPR